MIIQADALTRALPAIVVFAAFIGIWQLAVTVLGVREYLLPSPLSVLQAMGPGEIQWGKHIWITAVEIVGAFVIAALAGVIPGDRSIVLGGTPLSWFGLCKKGDVRRGN